MKHDYSFEEAMRNLNKNSRNTGSGFSLVSILVGVFVLVAGMTTIGRLVTIGKSSVVNQRALAAESIIFARAQSLLFNKSAIRASMNPPENVALQSCVKTLCSIDTASNPQPFLLRDPIGNAVAGDDGATAVRYSINGEKCADSAQKSKCPFVATAYFRAVCRNGSLSPCTANPPDTGRAVALLFYIKVAFDGPSPKNGTAPKTLTLLENNLATPPIAEFPVEMGLNDLQSL